VWGGAGSAAVAFAEPGGDRPRRLAYERHERRPEEDDVSRFAASWRELRELRELRETLDAAL
jgi:hypothetical protein